MQEQKGIAEKLPTVTRTNLENWKLLKKVDDEYLASNAFALLTSDHFQFSKIQCAVFKGTDRAVFLDKREYTGPIYEQIDEALGFVLRNIRLGAKLLYIDWVIAVSGDNIHEREARMNVALQAGSDGVKGPPEYREDRTINSLSAYHGLYARKPKCLL